MACKDFTESALIQITDEEFNTLVAFMHDRYGINLQKKRLLIEGRLSHLLRTRGFTSFQQYFDVVFKDPTGTELNLLLNKLTTNHTYFARENEHFDFLMLRTLPYLEKNRPSHDLRIWSAGCSSGQEPYNMAMAIDQYFGERKRFWDTTILATDISVNVLSKAQRAVYPEENIKNLPPQWIEKYFNPLENGQYEVCDAIKQQVVFKTFNLMDSFTIKKPFDIIFCRNVMIYFDNPTTDRLVNKFYDATAPGGYFFIGHSEVLNKDTRYKYIQPAIYQRSVNK